MEYLIATFKSRAETIRFSDILRGYGVPAEIVNTPREAGVGCGLSVKSYRGYLGQIKRALFNSNLKTFVCFFSVTVSFGKKTVRRI